MFQSTFSPLNKRIKYHEGSSKILNKRRSRISIGKELIFNSPDYKENDINIGNSNDILNINVKNKKLKKSYGLDLEGDKMKKMKKNNSMPVVVKKKFNSNIASIKEVDSNKEFGILDDFLKNLEEKKTNMKKKEEDKPMEKELNKLFSRNGYKTYFHLSRTQQNINSNIWNDFYLKREKI